MEGEKNTPIGRWSVRGQAIRDQGSADHTRVAATCGIRVGAWGAKSGSEPPHSKACSGVATSEADSSAWIVWSWRTASEGRPSSSLRDELQERGFYGWRGHIYRWWEPAYRGIGWKTLGEGGGITPGRGGGLDEGVSLVSDLSVSSGYTKRVQAGGEVPTHRGTSARIDACTVKNER
jgi:hypothetical protein